MPKNFSDLSFVRLRPDGSVDYWAVTPSEDYALNNQTGRTLALEFIEFARQESQRTFPCTLGMIARAMGLKRDDNGLSVGFWKAIQQHIL